MEIAKKYDFNFNYKLEIEEEIEDKNKSIKKQVIKEELDEFAKKVESIITLNNKDVKGLTAYLLDEWVCQQATISQYIFLKHIKSNKQNKLYQIILSGNDYDGVYEFNFKGYKVGVNFIKDNFNKVALHVHSSGNYDIALFKGNKAPDGYCDLNYCPSFGYSVIRAEYESEEAFKNALFATGYITEEEYADYTSSNNKIYSEGKSRVIFD